MIYLYNKTFYGLLTCIFEGYKDLENITIVDNVSKIGFLEESREIITDSKKASRVKSGIISAFSYEFFKNITVVFRSDSETKGQVIARTTKGMYREGFNYINSPHEDAVEFMKLLKYVYGENHTYKGLLRFRDIEGGFLYGQMRPKSDILDLLTPHFIRRLPNEKFIIHDVGRNLFSVYENGYVDYLEDESFQATDTDQEEFFKNAWIKFYDTIAIEERKNKKLMISNMPKYHWEFLPERNK